MFEKSGNLFASSDDSKIKSNLISIVKPFANSQSKRKHVVALLLLLSRTTEVPFDVLSDNPTTSTFLVITTINNKFASTHKLLSKVASGVRNINPAAILLKVEFYQFRLNVDKDLNFTFSIRLPEEVQKSDESCSIHISNLCVS